MDVSEGSGPAPGPGALGRVGRLMALVLAAALTLGASACGDEDDDPDDLSSEVEEAAESAGARGVAEVLRLFLIEQDLDPGEHERDVTVLREAVDDVPGEPDVAGIEDADGDGLDDDGDVEVRVNEEVACMTVAMDGDIDVTGGEC